jgi:hypothetical protein
MKRFRWAAAFCACFGLLVPRLDVLAAETGAPAAPAIQDVALTPTGEFTGLVVSAQGLPVEAANVTLSQGDEVVAQATTDAQGMFRVAGMSGGVYRVTAGNGSSDVRAWSTNAAPPNAFPQAVIVTGSAVRAQGEFLGMDPITLWILTASTGALILAAINQNDLNDLQDCCDALQSP